MDETAPDRTRQLDHLSLTQALVDFEVANARVTDLTQRLIDAANEITALRRELDVRRVEHEELERNYHRMVDSKTYGVAKGIEGVRRLLSR